MNRPRNFLLIATAFLALLLFALAIWAFDYDSIVNPENKTSSVLVVEFEQFDYQRRSAQFLMTNISNESIWYFGDTRPIISLQYWIDHSWQNQRIWVSDTTDHAHEIRPNQTIPFWVQMKDGGQIVRVGVHYWDNQSEAHLKGRVDIYDHTTWSDRIETPHIFTLLTIQNLSSIWLHQNMRFIEYKTNEWKKEFFD